MPISNIRLATVLLSLLVLVSLVLSESDEKRTLLEMYRLRAPPRLRFTQAGDGGDIPSERILNLFRFPFPTSLY